MKNSDLDFGKAYGEGLPRTILVAGVLLGLAILLGHAPLWANGIAGTCILLGALFSVYDRQRLHAVRDEEARLKRILSELREPPITIDLSPNEYRKTN